MKNFANVIKGPIINLFMQNLQLWGPIFLLIKEGQSETISAIKFVLGVNINKN